MAHGYLEKFGGSVANIYSAGLETHGLNPRTVEIMADDGIDISHHTSNLIEEYFDLNFDFIITVCDHANEHCPIFPNGDTKRLHNNFSDPSKRTGNEAEINMAFNQTRDEIKKYCQEFVNQNL